MTTLPSATPAKIFIFTVLEEKKSKHDLTKQKSYTAKLKVVLISSIKAKAILVVAVVT